MTACEYGSKSDNPCTEQAEDLRVGMTNPAGIVKVTMALCHAHGSAAVAESNGIAQWVYVDNSTIPAWISEWMRESRASETHLVRGEN